MGEPGPFCVNDQIDIRNAPASDSHPTNNLTQQVGRTSPAVLRVCIGKHVSNVAQRGSTEQGVGDCVQYGIGVGMTNQSMRVLDRYATKNKRPPRDQPVGVVTNSDSHPSDSLNARPDYSHAPKAKATSGTRRSV
jgi:hypothetical protein